MSHVHRAIEDRLGTQIDHAWLDAFRVELMDRMRTELCTIPGVKALILRVESAGFKTCVVIQDSVTGVQGALAAGMQVIGYDAEGSGELKKDGVIVVSGMDDIKLT
jgi:beta-phosphoglucomutase-like phosphatase (HAD superfamily)